MKTEDVVRVSIVKDTLSTLLSILIFMNSSFQNVHSNGQTPSNEVLMWADLGRLIKLKSSRNKKDLNDVTAALFSVSFSQLPAAQKTTKNKAAVTSLSSIFRDNFRINKLEQFICKQSHVLKFVTNYPCRLVLHCVKLRKYVEH